MNILDGSPIHLGDFQEQFFQKWWTLLLISRNHLESKQSFGAHVLRKTPMKRYLTDRMFHEIVPCFKMLYVVKT